MQTWIISGARSGVGKTRLARGLVAVLPSCVYAKLGHGEQKPGKPDNFFTSEAELDAFLEACRGKYEHAVVESNAHARRDTGEAIGIFVEARPGSSDLREDIVELRNRADLSVGRGALRAEWESALREHIADGTLVAAVLRKLGQHQSWLEQETDPGGSLGAADRFEVIRVRGDHVEPAEALVATEVAFTIMANDTEIATLMCSPSNLEEFCFGFLFTSGVIQGKSDVVSVSCDRTRWVGHVRVREVPEVALLDKRLYTSGCGKGVMYASVVELACRHPVESRLRLEKETVIEVMEWLQGNSGLHRESGGVHTAGLSIEGGRPATTFDDIGRHNAVDKVVGDALMHGVDFSKCALFTSGRLSSEILHKAKRCGISVVVSRSAPTHQTVLRAREMGVTLIGFARGSRFNLYGHPHRIVL